MTKEQEKYAREASLKIGGAIVCVQTEQEFRSYPALSRDEAIEAFDAWDDAFCVMANGVVIAERKADGA